ncbi:MAG: hypothetical protein K8T20_04255 [Planctomycetes bacterium]|nr:hypothetical protein [Planctomycetota bacterium]
MFIQWATFVFDDHRDGDHLNVILSNPKAFPGRVVTTNLTSYRESQRPTKVNDSTTVFDPGVTTHPWVTKKTQVSYFRSKIQLLSDLEADEAKKLLDWHPPLTKSMQAKILDHLWRAAHAPREIRQELIAQGVLR